ncbi:MAG: hypothetical protein V2A63_02780 [Patescibacteria group bacterium]
MDQPSQAEVIPEAERYKQFVNQLDQAAANRLRDATRREELLRALVEENAARRGQQVEAKTGVPEFTKIIIRGFGWIGFDGQNLFKGERNPIFIQGDNPGSQIILDRIIALLQKGTLRLQSLEKVFGRGRNRLNIIFSQTEWPDRITINFRINDADEWLKQLKSLKH